MSTRRARREKTDVRKRIEDSHAGESTRLDQPARRSLPRRSFMNAASRRAASSSTSPLKPRRSVPRRSLNDASALRPRARPRPGPAVHQIVRPAEGHPQPLARSTVTSARVGLRRPAYEHREPWPGRPRRFRSCAQRSPSRARRAKFPRTLGAWRPISSPAARASSVLDRGGAPRKGERVRILDDFSTGRRQNLEALKGKVEVVEGVDRRRRASWRAR